MTSTRALIEKHWNSANAQDWDGFASVLSPQLLYEVPQTRERVRGKAGYLDFFRTWPGPWRADIQQIIAEPTSAVSIIRFVTTDDQMTGITFFEVSGSLIVQVTDFWPSAYEPPKRESAHVERY